MHRRTLLTAGAALPAAASTGLLLGSSAQARPVARSTLARGLSFPWGIDFLPNGDGLVTERNSGRVLRVRRTGGFSVVGTVPGAYNAGGEGGLLGLALSPRFVSDRWVYLFLTTRVDNRVVRVRYADGRLGRPDVVLSGIPRSLNHNGGGLLFTGTRRPSLFVTTGDTRRPELAQNRRSLAGKILRLKPDGSAQDGNPFGSRVYSYGHRNPQAITLGDDGRLWATELGENTWDELNQIREGRNYGWARVEGADGPRGYTDPFSQWHPVNCSPSGVAVLKGRAWVGALRGESLWSVDIAGLNRRRRARHFEGRFGRIRMACRAPDDSLWIGTSNGPGRDRIIRVTVT